MVPAAPARPPGRTEPARRARRLRRPPEAPLTAVIGGVAVGLLLAYLHHFRIGSLLMALSVLAGAAMRLVLPERDAGLFAVRSRGFDVVTLATLGLGLLVFALVVPPG